ncbi:MAG: Gfo/Idh/MocA family protein [Rhodospirillales bacterium]|jgi:predicted dehydrogenase
MLNAAVIGLGWWGTTISNSLKGSDKIRIIVGVDIDIEHRKKFEDKNKVVFYEHIDGALNDKKVDAIIIATPHALHEEMFLAATAAGKQVFCEKPFALTSKGAHRMMAAAKTKGLIIGIGHERRYEGAFEEMKRMVDDGELGKLLHLEFNASYNNMVKIPATGWRKDPLQAPAGTMTALGIHQTDFMQTLAGPVAKINAQLKHRSDDFPNEDILTVQMLFKSGITGVLTSLATTPFYQRMSVFGDRGWVENREISNVDMPDPAILTWRGMDEEIHTRSYKVIDTVKQNFESWADAVRGIGTYRFDHSQILHNVQILETIVRSINSGVTEQVA